MVSLNVGCMKIPSDFGYLGSVGFEEALGGAVTLACYAPEAKVPRYLHMAGNAGLFPSALPYFKSKHLPCEVYFTLHQASPSLYSTADGDQPPK